MTGDIVDEPESPEERRLLAELRGALGADQMPSGLVDRASGLVDAFSASALAELIEQSGAELVGMRGGGPADGCLFEVADGSLAVELRAQRDRLVGQVLAGAPALVELEQPTGVVATTSVDELSRFSFPAPTGPVRLRLIGGDGVPVTTDWIHL